MQPVAEPVNVSAIGGGIGEAAPDKEVGDQSREGVEVEMADGKALQRAFMGTGHQPLAAASVGKNVDQDRAVIEEAKRKAQRMKQSQLGSVAQTKRTVLSNNWTD